jgi:GAF domain-containing protein
LESYERDRLTQALIDLSAILFTQQSMNEDLERLVRICAQVVPHTSGVSVSMLIDGEPRTVAVTDQVTLELDLVQYDNSDGPCLKALGGPIVRIGYIPHDEEFPHFAIGAADRRVVSSLSLPVRHEGRVIGSLNMYSHVPHAFDARSEEAALVFAAEVALAIVASDLFKQAKAVRLNLQQVHDQDASVSQAEGVLMGIHSCTAAQAHTLIQSAADANHETLAQVAERILETVRELDDAPTDT